MGMPTLNSLNNYAHRKSPSDTKQSQMKWKQLIRPGDYKNEQHERTQYEQWVGEESKFKNEKFILEVKGVE